MRRVRLLAALALGVAMGRSVHAEEQRNETSVAPEGDRTPPGPTQHAGYWSSPPARFFLSSMIDVGYLYLRPRLSFGYGRPFTTWIGVDANPIVISGGLGAYAGVRVQVPWFDIRVGARGFSAFRHNFLLPADRFTTADLDSTTGQKARYVTLEAELSGGIPAGPGSILFVLTASAVEGVPSNRFVYEETLRVITDPPAIYRGRTGYALRFGPDGCARVGLVGEALFLPERDAVVYRAGIISSFAIDDHLEALGLLVVPVWGPDSIGIAGGDYGELGIRYRWASGQ